MNENIFSNFYNKVLSFFQNEKIDGESAKVKATNRLKLVLMQDRSNLDGATMQKMREQLIAVISKYIEIDKDALNLNLESEGDEIALMLNIPVIRARTPEEIDELEKAEEDAKKEDIKAAIEAEIAELSKVSENEETCEKYSDEALEKAEETELKEPEQDVLDANKEKNADLDNADEIVEEAIQKDADFEELNSEKKKKSQNK